MSNPSSGPANWLEMAQTLPETEQRRLLNHPIRDQSGLSATERKLKAALHRQQGILRRQANGQQGSTARPESSVDSPHNVQEGPGASSSAVDVRSLPDMPPQEAEGESKPKSQRGQLWTMGREMAPTMETAIKLAGVMYVQWAARDMLAAGLHPDQLAPLAPPPEIAAQLSQPAARIVARTPIGRKYHTQIGAADDALLILASLAAWNASLTAQLSAARAQWNLPDPAAIRRARAQAVPQAPRNGGPLASLFSAFRQGISRAGNGGNGGNGFGGVGGAAQPAEPGNTAGGADSPAGNANGNGHYATTDGGAVIIGGQAYQPAEW